MGIVNHSKLNQLQQLLPEGLVAPASWLAEKGYSHQLVKKYLARGWLESPVRGVYRRSGPPLKWEHVVASLQNLLGSDATIGGRAAVELHGHAHYLRMSGNERVHLYANKALPRWIHKLGLKDTFVTHRDSLFENPARPLSGPAVSVKREETLPVDPQRTGLTQITWGQWDWPLTYSTLERAMLEMLDEVPMRESFHDADAIMQSLATLSPRRLTQMLKECRSVKVKRLFLALAEKHQHPWLDKLDVKDFDLGKGKRVLIPGERLHPKYQITWPREFDAAPL